MEVEEWWVVRGVGRDAVLLTMVGQKADVQEDGLVLGRGARQRVGVERLPGYGGVGVAAHVRAVALGGAVAQLREGGPMGGS
jgi:hypothetical protein